MKHRLALAALVVAVAAPALAYVEAPHSLGQVCRESTHIVLLEVTRVNKEKGLVLYKKVRDLKGKHPQEEVKHNIGKRGFHAREWQAVMNWAEPGKKAVFFHNGGASETFIGKYWYQCYPEGEWWGMSHGEPFLLRTFVGEPDKLAEAVERILKGEEVVVTCFADGPKDQFHQGKGKLQRVRASLKRGDYNAKRDFVALGGDGDDFPEFKTVMLLPEGAAGWRFQSAGTLVRDDRWRQPGFDDKGWRTGKAPVGYGEEELSKRQGTQIAEKGQTFVFRHAFELPESLLAQKGITFRLAVASDDSAEVYLNGQLADRDPEEDHEFSYWNRDLELAPRLLKPGKNTVAVLVKNKQSSSDLYFDLEVSAQVPVPKPPKPVVATPGQKPAPAAATARGVDTTPPRGNPPGKLTVDRQRGTVTLSGLVAPRKLPMLDQTYPIEVGASYPTPRGQKAHETVITFTDVKPSEVHQALVELGLKPGRPALGEGAKADGPAVRVYLEFEQGGKQRRVPLEELLVDGKTGKAPPPFRWHFTGSVQKQPDPERDEKFYGADLTGTLIALFPVTDATVLQASLTMKDEAMLKLETRRDQLPREGTPVLLILEVAR